jgi:hypothetical protein
MTPTQQPTDTTDPLNNPSGTTVASEAMQSVFCMTPHAWQEQAISRISDDTSDSSFSPTRSPTTTRSMARSICLTRLSTDKTGKDAIEGPDSKRRSSTEVAGRRQAAVKFG